MRNNHSTGARRGRRAPVAPASRPEDTENAPAPAPYQPGDDPDPRQDIRQAVAEAAAGKTADLVAPISWYPLTDALRYCDRAGWNEWCRLAGELRPTFAGATEMMSAEEAARHLLDYPHQIAMLAEFDDIAREMLRVVKGMVAELGAIGYRNNIEGTFLADDGTRRPLSPEQWRAVAERSVIPTWPTQRDILHYRFIDDGALRLIEGLRFSGVIFRGSPHVGDLYAVPAPRQAPPPRRRGGSAPNPIWLTIEEDAVKRLDDEGIDPDARGALAHTEVIINNLLGVQGKTFGEKTVRKHAHNALAEFVTRRTSPHRR